MLETENPERTSCCILVDKEEIGSVGATGMHSRFFEDYVAELMALTEDGNPLKVRRALRNSYMLSSDVSAAFDPLYADAFEKKNTAYFEEVWYLTNLPEAAERITVTMQMQNISQKYVRY